MESGFQSSLQSHEFKSETNFVVDGEALVLYGLEAPKNENEEIILENLNQKYIFHSMVGQTKLTNYTES